MTSRSRPRPRRTSSIDARLHLRPYTEPHFDIAVAAVASPTGPRLAGRYGLGLLSVGATLTPEGFDALGHHWGVAEERAQAYGQTVDRKDWRLVGLVHAAETREQAYKEVEYGIEQWFRYFEGVAAFPQMGIEGDAPLREMVEFVNTSGRRRDRHLGGRGGADREARRRRATAGSARTSCSPTSGRTRRRRSAPTSSSRST